MTLHRKIIAASLCSTVLTTPAFAQTESDDAVDTSNVIIVTATRRAEDVQDIPMAVTAVSPVQLERQGVVNVTQLAQVSPSFSSSNAQTSGGTNVFRIRGVGTTSNNIGFESAVGIFIDGAYQSRAGVALSEFVDIERLEVLRGPQGTLFGRNTSAGALNITTRRPDVTEFGGFVNASYGNFDLMSIQGAVNVPVVRDTLALRFTGAYRERDGYVDVVDGTGVIGQSNSLDQFIVRGQLGYEGRGGLNIRLIADYSEVSGNCCNAVELQRSGLETGGIFARVGLGPTGGNFAPSTGLDALDDRISSESFASTSRIEQWGITGEIEFPISNSVDLIYIGSYRDYESRSRTDSDFTSLDIFSTGGAPTSGTRIQTMTHELRLQGEALDGALQWLIGGYYSDEDIDSTVYALLGEDYGEHVGALLFPSTRGAFGANPLTVFSGGIDPAGTSTLNNFTQSSTSWSLFTHNTLEVAEGLEITVGLRYSDESKDGAFQQLNANNAICPAIASNILGAPPAGAFPIPGALAPTLAVLGCFPFTAPADLPAAAFLPLPRTFDDRFSDEELIYTGNISYNIQDLGNIYASFTHGYKSGGFNLDSTAATGGADPRFASEEVNAYEVGFKSQFLDNAITINIALFHEEFSNFQVLEFTGTQFQTFNVPRAESTGFELESVIRPDDHFTFNLGLTFADAEYPSDCATAADPVRVRNLCGNPLTNAPQLTGIVGATYRNEIGNNLSYFLNGQLRMESDRRTSTQARVVPNAAAIAAAGSVDAAIAASPLLPFDVQDGNVKINLRAGIGAADESWALEAWVTNLTNEMTRGVTFSTTLRSGSRSAFPQEPRLFGVTLRSRF